MGVRHLTTVEVTDEGDDGWGWECPACGKKMTEDDPLGAGDILICDHCGHEFKTV